MNISVELNGQLLPQSSRRLSLDLGSEKTVHDVAILLGLDPEEIGLIAINGVQSEMEDALKPDCRLSFFPYVTGG
jgi:molybdopterin converting factor small subunit